LAFLLGGVAGAALALLYAPEPGRETRRKLKEGLEGTGDWARDKYDDARDAIDSSTGKVMDLIEGGKEEVKSAFDAGKGAFEKGKERFLKKEPV